MNFGIWEMLIILAIVALLFGTAKLRNIGGDLGSALKSFRSALADDTDNTTIDSDRAQEATEQQNETRPG